MIRRSYLKPGQPPKRKTGLRRSQKPIPQMNVAATTRRVKRNARRMRSPEYKAARAGAVARSGGRCEYTENAHLGSASNSQMIGWARCPETKRLQFHEIRYPKTRILTKDDGEMLCPPHHRLKESRKLHKIGKRAFA